MYRGFLPEINPETNTPIFEVDDIRQEFKESFKKINGYFAAGHSLNIDQLQISRGDGAGTKVRLTKTYPATTSLPERKAHFTILLPPLKGGKSNLVTVSQSEIAEILCDRREEENNPPLLMTLSCSSSSSVRAWMNSFRESVDLDIRRGKLKLSEVQDLPLVIGANRGFSTGSKENLVENMEFGLQTIDQIMNAAEAEEIVTQLRRPLPDQFYRNLEALPGLRAYRLSARPSFDPACNRDPGNAGLFSFSNLLNEIIIQDTEGGHEFKY